MAEGGSCKQILIVAVGVALTLGVGVALEGGLTPENAALWTKWRESRANAPSPLRIRNRASEADFIAGDTAQIAELERAHDPEMLASAYLNRAAAYLAQREPNRAKMDLAKAASLNAETNTRRLILQERAAIYANCDRNYAGALADLDAAYRLAVQPSTPYERFSDAFMRVSVYNATRRYDLAVTFATTALTALMQIRPPSVPGVTQQRSNVLFSRGINRTKGFILLDRGYAHARNGDAAGARTDYDVAIKLVPSARAYDERGALNFREGHIGAALADYWQGWKLGRPRQQRFGCSR